MEAYQLALKALLILVEIAGGFGLIVLFSYLGVMVYDELTSRTNDLYELLLTVVVGIEFLFRGRPKSKTPYEGRHRVAEKFIDELVDEMRIRPGSLCYDKKLATSVRTYSLSTPIGDVQ